MHLTHTGNAVIVGCIFLWVRYILLNDNHYMENRTMIKLIDKWRKRNETLSALNSLSDRELRDIGLTRGEINRVVYEEEA